MNKAKNVERMTAYVKKVNVMVEKKKQNKKIRSGEVAKAASFTYLHHARLTFEWKSCIISM